MAIMARHSMEIVPSLQVVRSSIPDEVEDAVMQSLEKTPADRFQTMKEFAERLSDAEAEAATMRTAQRRASTAARRASGPRTGATARRSTEEIAPPGRSGARMWSFVAGGLLLLAAIGFGAWKFLHKGGVGSAAGDAPDRSRIAVLYFENRSGQDSLGYLADGLTEALIHELSGIKPLQVISRNGVSPYRNAAVAPDSVGRALHVGTLVQGTVAGSRDRLRVSVSLIDAVTGEEIGSKTLERPREEIFALQDDLAKEVSQFLRERLGQQIQLEELRVGTRDPHAWELLQRASKLSDEVAPLLASGDTAAAGRRLVEADTLLAAAEKQDPNWVRPAIDRGWLAYHQTDLISSFDKPIYGKWTARGLEHANHALKLKPGDPDALELRGTLEYLRWILNLEPDPAAAKQLNSSAEQDLRTAVNAKPTAAWAWTWLSHLLMGQGQTAEAKLAAVRSYEADPYLSSAKQTLYRLFGTSYDLDDRVEATHWCDVGHRRFPDYYRFTECRLNLLGMKGQKPDVQQAWQLHDELVKLTPPNLRAYNTLYGNMLVAMALVRAGLPDSARALASRSSGDATIDPTQDLAYYQAIVRAQLGDKDEAFRLLSTYVATNPQMRAGLGKDQGWIWSELRRDPRFATMFGTP
jgi:TolB-like protein